MIRVIALGIAIWLFGVSNTAVACTASCDHNCGRFCRNVLGNRVCEPVAFNGCLSSERVCREAENAKVTACRAEPNFAQVREALRQARRQGALNAGQCREGQRVASTIATYKAGPLAGAVVELCGCVACQDAFQ